MSGEENRELPTSIADHQHFISNATPTSSITNADHCSSITIADYSPPSFFYLVLYVLPILFLNPNLLEFLCPDFVDTNHLCCDFCAYNSKKKKFRVSPLFSVDHLLLRLKLLAFLLLQTVPEFLFQNRCSLYVSLIQIFCEHV